MSRSSHLPMTLWALVAGQSTRAATAFVSVSSGAVVVTPRSFFQNGGGSTIVALPLAISSSRTTEQEGSVAESNRQQPQKEPKKKKNRGISIREYTQQVLANPAKYFPESSSSSSSSSPPKKKKSTYKRTRKRVENPKQTYLYAKQRKALLMQQQQQTQQQQNDNRGESDTVNDTPREEATTTTTMTDELVQKRQSIAELILELNMAKPSTLHCDPLYQQEPQILGKLWVSKDNNDTPSFSSDAYAYLIDKPPGWAVMGSKTSTTISEQKQQLRELPTKKSPSFSSSSSSSSQKSPAKERVKIVEEDGSVDYLEFNEQDVFDLMTDEEIQDFLDNGGVLPPGVTLASNQAKQQQQQEQQQAPLKQHVEARDDGGSADYLEYNEQDVFDLMTEEVPEFLEDRGKIPPSISGELQQGAAPSTSDYLTADLDESNPTRFENLRRIQTRLVASKPKTVASFNVQPRPSVVNWLKETLEQEYNRTIRGGNFWKAVAGATNVDDSGVVLLCPKSATSNIFCDSIQYTAVVGNGKFLAPASLSGVSAGAAAAEAKIDVQTLSKLKKARDDDLVETVQINIPGQASSCDSVVALAQKEYQDGIRGDPLAHPLERRAHRRLIHCQGMTVSSLVQDDSIQAETPILPDDIAILSERRNRFTFEKGSFLGRSWLRDSGHTTTYREINGAADGFPGWIVDRYGKWLLVQHDPDLPRGPLPSIHDGRTAGVYYLEVGMEDSGRPRFLEGKEAPELLTVSENGVKYVVSLDKDLSTGIFLDQRPQRHWLARNCGPNTRLLNCFAHTGAFSVAAATAGASTVSIDLSKKWLDRLPLHFKANNIDFDERHDAIYGDCFDWLARLAKRGEKYDIVILDPPSTSVAGRKKKRWSIKSDMDELVALAAQLVLPGGLLWITTRNAGLPAAKFARSCRKGLEQAGFPNAKLERIQPMPSDFQTIGPQHVKNLVWRFPLI